MTSLVLSAPAIRGFLTNHFNAMLYAAIDHIRKVLATRTELPVAVANIAEVASGGDADHLADIIISLVNIEDVRMARNQEYMVRIDNQLYPKNAPVNLDLWLLFTAYSGSYENDIRNLQEVLSLFQRQPVFTQDTVPELADDGIEKLVIDMVSLSFDQLQQLWSMLGGKYQPSVLYKMRMITIDSIETSPHQPIMEIQSTILRKEQHP